MPNHVLQKIIFPASEAEHVFSKVLRNGEVDFGTLVPMPIHIYRGDLTQVAEPVTKNTNWYDWGYDNWGTKWNAYNTQAYVVGEPKVEGSKAVLQFTTANGIARSFIQAFANTFKTPFTLSVSGEVDCLFHEVWDLEPVWENCKKPEFPTLKTRVTSVSSGEEEFYDFMRDYNVTEFPGEDYVFLTRPDNTEVVANGYLVLRPDFKSEGKTDGTIVFVIKPEQVIGTLIPSEQPATAASDIDVGFSSHLFCRDFGIRSDGIWQNYKIKTESGTVRAWVFCSPNPILVENYDEPQIVVVDVNDVDTYTTKGLQKRLHENETTASSAVMLTSKICPGDRLEDFIKDMNFKIKMLNPILGNTRTVDVVGEDETFHGHESLLLLNPYYKDPTYGWWIPYFCSLFGCPKFVNIDVDRKPVDTSGKCV